MLKVLSDKTLRGYHPRKPSLAGLQKGCHSAAPRLAVRHQDSFGDSATRTHRRLAEHGTPEKPSLSHCQVSQRTPWRSHLWATEPKPTANVCLACLHHQLGSETPSIWIGTILPMARKGISDCTRQMNDSIKTYSRLKIPSFITAWGRRTTFAVYREFRFFFFFALLCPCPSPPPFQSDKLLGKKFDISQNLMINGTGKKIPCVY